jgi:hypothetical protein
MQMRFGARACCHVIKRSYKNAGSQQFGKRVTLRLRRSIDHVEWNAEPREVVQIHRDCRIWARPIRTHSDDVRLGKPCADFIVLEHRQLIDFAGQAPSGGDVHKDSFAFADQALQRYRVKGLPSGFIRRLWAMSIRDRPTAPRSPWHPWNEAPRHLIRDRDRIYGSVVTRRLRSMGIRDKPTAPASPWQNGFAERLIGSIRREWVVSLSETQSG